MNPTICWFSLFEYLFECSRHDFPDLSFNGTNQPYFEKISMTARRYFTPQLNLECLHVY